ncbi:glycosyltransferase [Aristophania vespae]|uniref:glycosyltransferase n=1 Tax=Aristophania vespae TaxID=2697033 RepID=UPI0023517C70|nr:glycosyltransferase [Aristophania vespae]UMM64198.1 hypothetical protein DM15PD_11990 [Aristophania vespae]
MREFDRFLGNYGTSLDLKAERFWLKKRSQQAQNAYECGQDCLQKNLMSSAFFWLGRAARLAVNDPKVNFAYAMTALKMGYFEIALERLRVLRERFNLKEVVFSEILALWFMKRQEEAANLLEKALSYYVPPAEIYSFIHDIVAQQNKGGWAFLSNTGLLKIFSKQKVSVVLDGRRLGQFEAGEINLGSVFQKGIAPDWMRGHRLSVKLGKDHLFGSPFDIRALTRCESLVWPTASAIEGWLWYPAEPEYIPHIKINDGPWVKVETIAEVNAQNPLGQFRSFSIALNELPQKGRQTLHIINDHEVPLMGSPLEPKLGRVLDGKQPYPARFLPAPVQPRPARSSLPRLTKPSCAVIIPVYIDYQTTMTCLRSVLENTPSAVEIIVIDDASPEKSIVRALDLLAKERKITLLRNEKTCGFPASVNKGLHYAEGSDVILLNSDTIVPKGWVQRLTEWLTPQDVGTVTPLSNNGGLLSYPSVEKENPFPDLRETRRLDQFCRENGTSVSIELPTANGFCMAISAECLAETGLLRDDIFAQGYGEENDFSIRATARGFRHIAAVNLYVRHKGGNSFKGAKQHLIRRNLKILNALHPGYDLRIFEFMRRDPLFLIRRRLDLLRIMQEERPEGTVLLVKHNYKGGVARAVKERAKQLSKEGFLALQLRPVPQGCSLELCYNPDKLPNLKFTLPEEGMLLGSCLRRLGLKHIEWHHLRGHAPWVRRLHSFLNVPYDIYVHDHVWFCPRIILLNKDGHYCGESDSKVCANCIKHNNRDFKENIELNELLDRSQQELLAARYVKAPTHDAAKRLLRHFPSLPEIIIEPLEDEITVPARSRPQRQHNGRYRIGVLGGISRWKGYDILRDLGRYIQDHDLPLDLILIGSSKDDETLIASGVQVTGPYEDKDVLSLIAIQHLDFAFIPSVAPETWCYVLSWLWKAGLEVLCFDIGAVSERIKEKGNYEGKIIPLGIPIPRLAEYLLHYAKRSSHYL